MIFLNFGGKHFWQSIYIYWGFDGLVDDHVPLCSWGGEIHFRIVGNRKIWVFYESDTMEYLLLRNLVFQVFQLPVFSLSYPKSKLGGEWWYFIYRTHSPLSKYMHIRCCSWSGRELDKSLREIMTFTFLSYTSFIRAAIGVFWFRKISSIKNIILLYIQFGAFDFDFFGLFILQKSCKKPLFGHFSSFLSCFWYFYSWV